LAALRKNLIAATNVLHNQSKSFLHKAFYERRKNLSEAKDIADRVGWN
jgi:hypothetical protein